MPLGCIVCSRTSGFFHLWFICFESHTTLLLAHQILQQAQVQAMKLLIHRDGNGLVCCFRKQYAIESLLEQLIHQGEQNLTSSSESASSTEGYCFVNPMNIVECAVISPVVMCVCVLWEESSQTGPDSDGLRQAAVQTPHPTTPQSKATYCPLPSARISLW